MKVWKLVSGILCVVFFAVVCLQSCAAGVVNSLEDNSADTSASGGIVLAVLMLAGGIISIATRKGGKGGHIATFIVFLLAALLGFANLGTYGDLKVWSAWCLICAVLALIGIITTKKNNEHSDVQDM